jgi:hypothetical protein
MRSLNISVRVNLKQNKKSVKDSERDLQNDPVLAVTVALLNDAVGHRRKSFRDAMHVTLTNKEALDHRCHFEIN